MPDPSGARAVPLPGHQVLMRSMVVQAGTCLALLALLVAIEVLIVRNLHQRWHEIDDTLAMTRAQYPGGVPTLAELRGHVDDIDRELGEQLYPRLHDLTEHLSATMASQQHNAQHIRVLEGQLAICDSEETSPPAGFFSDTAAWLRELFNQVAQLRSDIAACRSADGRLNQEIVTLGSAVGALQRRIDSSIHDRDLTNTLLLDPGAYARVHRAYLGAGRTLLVIEHLTLLALLAMLTMRYVFRLLILCELPGEVILG